jgi:hypothetical protein
LRGVLFKWVHGKAGEFLKLESKNIAILNLVKYVCKGERPFALTIFAPQQTENCHNSLKLSRHQNIFFPSFKATVRIEPMSIRVGAGNFKMERANLAIATLALIPAVRLIE